MTGQYVSEQARRQMLQVQHFKNSHYAQWDLDAVLASYVHGYVDPLLKLTGAGPLSVADIGTGYGWLAFAFALRTDARIIAVDFDAARVVAAKEIAAILGVGDRIEWRVGGVGSLPLRENEVDAAFCLEVIEHVSTDPAIIRDIARTTRDLVVVSTPNGALPVVFHDTSLPFCHWLPVPWRDAYARAFGKGWQQSGNRFWRPRRLARALPEFERISAFFHYRSYADYQQARAKGMKGQKRTKIITLAQPVYFALAAKLGAHSYYVLPNLASTWRRRTRVEATLQPANDVGAIQAASA